MKLKDAITIMKSNNPDWSNLWAATIIFILSMLLGIGDVHSGLSSSFSKGVAAYSFLIAILYSIPTVYYWRKFIKLLYEKL